jgi:hypothetical protein
MKKMLMIALALGLAVALAAPAMATDWSARGHIYVGGAIHETVPPAGPPQYPFFAFDGVVVTPPISTLDPRTSLSGAPPYFGDAWNDVLAWMRMAASLTITARQSEDLYGVLGFNMISSRWGEYGDEFDSTPIGSWYRPMGDDSGTLGVLLNEAYIDFRVPPKLPIWLRMGIQPFVIRPWIVVNTTGAGITGRTMIDPIKLSISAGWAKKWEGYDWDADDVDAFFGDIAMPIGPVRVGTFLWYEDHGLYLASLNPLGTPYNVLPYPDSGQRDSAQMYYVGVYADGKIGPVGLQFDWVYAGGNIDHNPAWWAGVLALPTPADQDIKAWVVRGVLDFSPMNRLKVGVGGLYATGENNATNDIEQFRSVNGYEGAGRQQGCPALQDFILLTDGVMGVVPCRGPGVGFIGGPAYIGGFWYARVFADFMATDWLRLVANFGWIGDTTEHGNRAIGPTGGPRINPADTTAGFGGYGNLRDDDDVGFEMDFAFNIQLYKNLQWGAGFGYLFAGHALDQYDPTTFSNKSPHDPWALVSAILYTF